VLAVETINGAQTDLTCRHRTVLLGNRYELNIDPVNTVPLTTVNDSNWPNIPDLAAVMSIVVYRRFTLSTVFSVQTVVKSPFWTSSRLPERTGTGRVLTRDLPIAATLARAACGASRCSVFTW
jgi:hypothetical protein